MNSRPSAASEWRFLKLFMKGKKMKLNEVMIIKKDDTGNRLKLLQVDDETMSKLTRIRGNLYKDDPRLRIARDLPTPEPKPVTSLPIVKQDESPKILSFEEQIVKDWRTRPDIRAEFTSLTSYEAYCRAVRDGRTKVYGRG